MKTEITSKENPIYKELKRSSSEKNSYIFIEGKKLFIEAVKSNIKINKILISSNNLDFLSEFSLKDPEIVLMNKDLIASLYSTENRPENDDLIICLATTPKWSVEDVFKTKNIVLYLDKIQDPGNLGTIIRSSLAFKAGGIILSNDSTYPFNTKVVRASAGSIFSLPIVTLENDKDLKNLSIKYSYKLAAMVKDKGQPLNKQNLDKNRIFLFGNEGSGLSKSVLDLADELITIPQSDKVESLNLATSVSITLWDNYCK